MKPNTMYSRGTRRTASLPQVALGRELRKARLARQWSQEEAAFRMGVSQSVYSRLERGRVRNVPDYLRNLQNVFGLRFDIQLHVHAE